MKRYFIVSLIGLLGFATLASAQERRFTIDELLKVRLRRHAGPRTAKSWRSSRLAMVKIKSGRSMFRAARSKRSPVSQPGRAILSGRPTEIGWPLPLMFIRNASAMPATRNAPKRKRRAKSKRTWRRTCCIGTGRLGKTARVATFSSFQLTAAKRAISRRAIMMRRHSAWAVRLTMHSLRIQKNSHLSAITIKSRRFQPTPTCGSFRFAEALRRMLPPRIAGLTARRNTHRMAASSLIDRKRPFSLDALRSQDRHGAIVKREPRFLGRRIHFRSQ